MLFRLAPTLLTATALLLCATAPAGADLILEVQSVTVAAGSTGDTFNVTLENTGPSSVSIAGFSFGLTSSSAVTFTDVTTATTPAYIFAGNSLFGPDIVLSAGARSVSAADNFATPNSEATLAANSTVGLGLVSFDIASGASGMIPVNIQPFPDTGLNAANGNNISITSFVSGTISISSVPEPASFILSGLGLISLAASRRQWIAPRFARS